MKIHKGDTIVVLAGKDKGKTGLVDSVDVKNNTITVSGLNVFKKHVKKSEQYPKGGVIELSRPFASSKVAVQCPHTKKPTRIGYKIVDGVKKRISKVADKII